MESFLDEFVNLTIFVFSLKKIIHFFYIIYHFKYLYLGFKSEKYFFKKNNKGIFVQIKQKWDGPVNFKTWIFNDPFNQITLFILHDVW